MEYQLDSDDDSDKPKREEAKTKFNDDEPHFLC